MDSTLRDLIELIETPESTAEDFANARLPEAMQAATVHRDEEHMFDGLPFEERDPRRSIHIDEVPVPDPGPNEVLVAVMGSAVNFNNVWTSMFLPAPAFQYLGDFASFNPCNQKHRQDFMIPGSDACGVVVRTGSAVQRWKPGDRVNIFGAVNDWASPEVYHDGVKDPHGRAWGFETNYGAFAQFTTVQQNQLLPKPEHLSWEEAASVFLVATTAYRMLVSDNGARMRQGDNVLIWGACGGLGCFAVQMVLNGGGTPIGIVSNERKAELVRRLGCPNVIVQPREKGHGFLDESGRTLSRQILRLKVRIRKCTGGEDPDIVFEHTGRSTFAASVAVARPGGKIVTCGSTSGYDHVFDNRYLWQPVKSIIGAHGANYYEAMQTARLVGKGHLLPVLSEVYPLAGVADALNCMHDGESVGKLGVLNLAPREGLGIRNRELREAVGEARINVFRRSASEHAQHPQKRPSSSAPGTRLRQRVPQADAGSASRALQCRDVR